MHNNLTYVNNKESLAALGPVSPVPPNSGTAVPDLLHNFHVHFLSSQAFRVSFSHLLGFVLSTEGEKSTKPMAGFSYIQAYQVEAIKRRREEFGPAPS